MMEVSGAVSARRGELLVPSCASSFVVSSGTVELFSCRTYHSTWMDKLPSMDCMFFLMYELTSVEYIPCSQLSACLIDRRL